MYFRGEKTPRYTQRERNMVLGFAAQYKDIIENKRTDAESNRKKDEVWRIIAKEFNTRVYHQRSSKQLRQLYKNMKLLLKKDLSVEGRKRNFMDILNTLSQQSPLHPYPNYPPLNIKTDYDEEDDERNGSSSYNSSEQPDNDVVVIKSEDFSDNDQSYNNDDMDDSISNKDIPEVCLDEPDGDEEYNVDQMPHSLNLKDTSKGGDFKCDSLIALAIEERKRKIDLINAQIEYWRALTKKLESTSSSSHCPCQMPRMNGVNQS